MGSHSRLEIHGDDQVIRNRKKVALTLGNFDGVHRGHQHLLRRLAQSAGSDVPTVLTFHPHPTRVLSPTQAKPLLLSVGERARLLLGHGVHAVVVQPFTPELAQLSADDFAGFLERTFDVGRVLLGFNFSYGKDRGGGYDHLLSFGKARGWIVEQATAFEIEGRAVSSSRIRDCLTQGRLEEANTLLGRNFSLHGEVVKGDQRGRTIGFPTANLRCDNEVVPATGVYACYVELEGKMYPAVMNCGVRPTVGAGMALQIEAHILDFSQDIYGAKIRFHMVRFLRGERRFSGLDALKAQIASDVDVARRTLSPEGSSG